MSTISTGTQIENPYGSLTPAKMRRGFGILETPAILAILAILSISYGLAVRWRWSILIL